MAGYELLKILFVAVAFGSQRVCGQNVVFLNEATHSVYFPKEDATVNRRVENISPNQPIEVRARNRPPCAETIDPANILTSPCVKDAQYNDNVQRLVSQLLTQSPSVNEIIQDPTLRVILNDTLTPNPAIVPSTRFGGARETPVCGAQEELIFPQRAKTPKDDWVFVVNQPDVKQALRVEKCTGEGRPCNLGVPVARDVSTVCRQKYVYRRMLVLGSNNIQPEEVLMPSCCVCYSRRENFDISTRLGFNDTTTDGTVSEDPIINQPTPARGQPGPGASIHFNPQEPPRTSPLTGHRAHMVHFVNAHSQQRRNINQRIPAFFLQPMRYD